MRPILNQIAMGQKLDFYQLLPRLQRSKFRMRFQLDQKDLAYIEKVGLEKISAHAADFIQKRLASAEPANDGKQTPFKGHPVFKAQHATATCCRGCLATWHSIPKGRALSSVEIQQIVCVLLDWIMWSAQRHGGKQLTKAYAQESIN
jgi:hypothetical protein